MNSGLWAFCRHPNYLGEIILWWGFGLVAFSASDAYVAFLGPAILTFLLVKVSGVACWKAIWRTARKNIGIIWSELLP